MIFKGELNLDILFSILILTAISAAAFLKNLNYSILSYWLAGMVIGAWYLWEGFEWIGYIQLLLSSIAATGLIFFRIIFRSKNQDSIKKNKLTLACIISIGVLSSALCIVFIGPFKTYPRLPMLTLNALGAYLLNHHILSLMILPWISIMILLGGAAIHRKIRH
jgi:NADH:ubiquinone oxidoreductase subunit 6 (subunit J)